MAKETGLKFSVIDAKQAKALGMGGITAVGAAGSTPPGLVCLEHKPKSTSGKGPILLVGKAVTFDTGGYSIKPAEGMDRMKYDKCGGMTVIGTMHALASLKVPQHVVGLIPIAENMVSEKAYRPGDIITFFNGVTAEITNTDAEGRLILADALAWGTQTYKPQAVVDLATLTGGVIVALGPHCAGCFCSDSVLRSKLFDAGDFTNERLWHLPLWDEHRAQLKGTHGDLVNSAGRDAHPIQGAAFLSYFVGPDGHEKLPTTAWAHLDIAGVADVKSDKGIFTAGPTGYGVRLLTRMIETW
jgi:leucyl aminopeptidase